MKNLKYALIILIILTIAGCATAPIIKVVPSIPDYTYEGEFDPIVFFGWEIMQSWVSELGNYHNLIKNPDKDSDVIIVETMAIMHYGRLKMIGYRYWKGDVEYIFGVTPDNLTHFEQLLPATGPVDKSGGI